MVDPVVMAAGSALVAAMATDAWRQARDGVVALWQRIHPDRAEQVGAELETLREGVLEARQAQDVDAEQALEGQWRLQFQALTQRDPRVAGELQRLLCDRLAPILHPEERDRVYSVVQNITVYGGNNFVAGRDVHTEPSAPKA
ncbi:hypothetical protein RB200_05940 [Streptomyces sp. PmtG]